MPHHSPMKSAMDSDSDSDGSHVSTTPPRGPNLPPPPPPPPPPPLLLPITSSNNSRIAITSSPHPTSKPTKHALKPPPIPSALSSSLPFQIRRPYDQPRVIPTGDSVETLPAGFFSKVPSFSKIRKHVLTFENDAPLSRPEIVIEHQEPSRVQPNLPKVGQRQHLNLIGSNVADPPVKIRKCSGGTEVNFVKLQLNGRKRGKYLSKCKGRSKSQNSYAYRKTRSKIKAKAENGIETESVCVEDGFVGKITQPKQKEDRRVHLLEEAVSAARNEPSDENLVRLLNVVYGHHSFRDGQLEAIKMVLLGRSTMLVLPTGAGKSLCYQIPAMIFPGITLVVSPLLALMIDQLKQLPPVIPGGLLSSSQKPEEVAETLRQVHERTIKVLFVSPERFLNKDFLSIFSATSLLSLVVVDEAHCISEWSHNFRPSYSRIRASLISTKLKAECILAMTATATTTILQAVMSVLEIPSSNLIQETQLRNNLELSISLSGNRMKDLLMLIKSYPFNEVQSIIIYCKFQYETNTISRYLCDNNISAKSYHSGLLTKERNHIQDLFCSNKIRVVVATVAFGMGLNKTDVGAVIHYSLPESLEEYVQEIGRAGRDGRLSYCHLFFDDITYFKLRSLMYSDGVDEYTVNKFLAQVFSDDINVHGKVCSLVKEAASRKFDMKEEVMLTLLTHLELGEVQYLHLLPQLNVTCTLNFHKTSPSLLADRDTLVAAILRKSEIRQGQYVFDIPNVANSIGVTATELSNQLQNLKLKDEITYEVKDPAFYYMIMEVPGDLCSLSLHLTKWLSEIEVCKVRKLDIMFDAAVSAVNVCDKIEGCFGAQHTPCLQKRILSYFNGDDQCNGSNKISQSSPFLRADIKVFLQSNSQAKFTPRAVARIMHGIASPAYPSTVWSKTHFWGRYTNIEFKVVAEVAKMELMNFVGKNSVSAAKKLA